MEGTQHKTIQDDPIQFACSSHIWTRASSSYDRALWQNDFLVELHALRRGLNSPLFHAVSSSHINANALLFALLASWHLLHLLPTSRVPLFPPCRQVTLTPLLEVQGPV